MDTREYTKSAWKMAKPYVDRGRMYIARGPVMGEAVQYEVFREKRKILVQNVSLFALILASVIIMQSQVMIMGITIMLLAGLWSVKSFMQFRPKWIRTTKEAVAGYSVSLLILKVVTNHLCNATPESLHRLIGPGSNIAPTASRVANAWLPTMLVLLMLMTPLAFCLGCFRQFKLWYTRESSEDPPPLVHASQPVDRPRRT